MKKHFSDTHKSLSRMEKILEEMLKKPAKNK